MFEYLILFKTMYLNLNIQFTKINIEHSLSLIMDNGTLLPNLE